MYDLIDFDNIVFAGHSMGATDSLMASHLYEGDKKVVLTVAQHPGLCGPIGPPPKPATWSKADLTDISTKSPILFTTAHNDGAFLPAPLTANHEYNCFAGAIGEEFGSTYPAAFIDFSGKACREDFQHIDRGHMCPCKTKNGGGPETPWVLTAMKLYAQ